ncbi:hypothetical protein HZS_5256, partial [Henneguya salminicola]
MSNFACSWAVLSIPTLTRGGRRCVLTSDLTDIEKSKYINIQSTISSLPQTGENLIKIEQGSFDIKLRPGIEKEILLTITNTVELNLDIYFLTDASPSMMTVTDQVYAHSSSIADRLSDTGTVHMGAGIFIDFPIIPFAFGSTVRITAEYKPVSFLFKNVLSLTDNRDEMKNAIDESRKVYASAETPEALFDAINQVSECQEKIGWRENTKKLIVAFSQFSVKLKHHSSVILVLPSDGKCHMINNRDVGPTEQGYVHPHQVFQSLSKNGIQLLFFVAPTYVEYYQ